jgi:hypothetical protein
MLRIDDANCIHQFLAWAPLSKDQRNKMWTLNLDYFKNCCLIILCGSSEHTNKKALFMQLILLAHEVKDCVNCIFVVG